MTRIVLSGRTAHTGVIGDPVAHSLSPALHNAAYGALGLDISYGAYRVREGEARDALLGARALGFLGLSVTTPHKEAIARAADQRSARVERLGAANTVLFRAGVGVAESTDGAGLLDDLAQAWAFVPDGQICAVLGAGGAARAVALSLAEAGAAEVLIVNRSAEHGARAVAMVGAPARSGALAELADAALVINATSLGLSPPGDPAVASSPGNLGRALAAPLGTGQYAVDLVYAPDRTAFLDAAEARGATVRNGLGMLVHQAALQFSLHTGEQAPLAVMWAAVSPVPQ